MDSEELLIAPAPLERVTEVLNEVNSNLPGAISVDRHGQLLKSYLKFSGFALPLIEAFNAWILTRLPRQIASMSIVIPANRAQPDAVDEVIRFERFYVDNPSVTTSDGLVVPDFPALAAEAERTYAASVYADLVSSQGRRAEKIFLFKVPVMVGSDLDNLKNKTDEEKLRLRHDPRDPGGWFSIRGAEKLVLWQEKLRANKAILFFDTKKATPICKMTCMTIRGSKIVSVRIGKKHKTIKLGLQFLGKDKTMPVFSAFRLLGVTDTNEMFRYVAQFLKFDGKLQRKAYFALQASFLKLLAIGNDVDYIAAKKGISSLPVEVKEESIRRGLIEDLFPQVSTEYATTPEELQARVTTKLQMLSMLVARLTEHMAGARDFDDRDSWSNKRLDSAAPSMEQLFMGLWNKMHNEMEKNIAGVKVRNFDDVVREVGKNTITSEFVSSFSSNNWGVKEKYQKENITDYLKRDSLIATYSHLLRINTPTSRKTKSPHLREVQQTALGIVCPSEVPEGENCGLVKNLALTAYMSINRDDVIIKQAIAPYIRTQASLETSNKCLLNGIFLGWCAGPILRDFCLEQRRNGRFYKDVCINLDRDGFLHLYCDGSRPMRPLLIVDKDGKLIIEKKNLWGASFDELLREGCVEYVDAFEQEDIMLAQSIWDMETRMRQREQTLRYVEEAKQAVEMFQGDTWVAPEVKIHTESGVEMEVSSLEEAEKALKEATNVLEMLQKKRPFTHCELDPQAILGLSASIMPFPERSQAPRVTYQASMIKQALGIYHSNYNLRFDTTAKVLAFPTRPLFEPQVNALVGLNEAPAGITINVAIMNFLGFNQEDALIFKKEAIERGLFVMTKYISMKTVRKQSREFIETFERPPVRKGEPEGRYAHLDENGIVRVGSQVRQGDCIVGKTRRNTATGEVTNASLYVGIGDEGIVDRVVLSFNMEEALVARIKIRQVRAPIVGDKFASRYAQKGTIGLIIPARDLPFNEKTGMVPDLIINPTCIPSRMTVGKLVEIIASKYAALAGERVDASPFRPFDLELFKQTLINYGYNRFGTERFRSGATGQLLVGEIFTGPCYYQALRHHVKDKLQARGRGNINPRTHQPVGGRSLVGGQRVGNMETDSFISHGASAVLQERLCYSSDAYRMVMCQTCGTIAISNVVSKEFICRQCGDKGNFGTTTAPYTLKLLIQMLGGVGFNVAAGLTRVDEIQLPKVERAIDDLPSTSEPPSDA